MSEPTNILRPVFRRLPLLTCLIAAAFGFGVLLAESLQVQAASFYVAPNGNDNWSGKLAQPDAEGQDGPFATLERARQSARALKERPKEGVTVFLRGGEYYREAAFELTSEDSGLDSSPVIYRNFPGETPRLIGGVKLPGFAPVEDESVLRRLPEAAREQVVQCDLKALGIEDYGLLKVRGFGRPENNAALELFFNQAPMILARWPNAGWSEIADVLPDSKEGGFIYTDERIGAWAGAEDVWLHGLWYHDWADSYARVKRIDPETKTIYTEEPHGVYGYRKGQRFYALNLLEELDEPGQWYLDRAQGVLYFWPPAPVTDGEALVSLLEEPLIAIRNARGIRIEGLTLECSRGHGITVENSHEVEIAGCTVRNLGRHGIVINGGSGNRVLSCDLHHIGELGIRLNGGNRQTLTPGNHRADNNHIRHFSRAVITYRPAISLAGVGHTASNNLMHDAPHAAVLFSGNNHRLEFNEVHSVCRETGDVGVFYIGRDWTMRGHLVRHNFFHNIFGPYSWGAKSVYLDDGASGVSIVGNIFYKSHEGAFIGGGRDNRVENNLFIDCNPAVHVDARGITFHKQHIVEGGSWRMYDKLRAMKHDQPPYSEAYPELARILEGNPAMPLGNSVVRNASFGGRWLRLQNVEKEWVTFQDNYVSEDEGEVDWVKTGFRLPEDHPALERGFKPIPVEKIGLRPDEFRWDLPERKLAR